MRTQIADKRLCVCVCVCVCVCAINAYLETPDCHLHVLIRKACSKEVDERLEVRDDRGRALQFRDFLHEVVDRCPTLVPILTAQLIEQHRIDESIPGALCISGRVQIDCMLVNMPTLSRLSCVLYSEDNRNITRSKRTQACQIETTLLI